MKVIARPLLFLVGLGSGFLGACGGAASPGGGTSTFRIEEVSNGFGRLLPYEIALRDSEGNPTGRVIEITSVDDLVANVTQANPIRPPTEWPVDTNGQGNAVLPSNVPGNHFVYARFSQDIDIDSVLNPLVSAEDTNNMTTAIQVAAYDPDPPTGIPSVTLLRGRAFVGGRTYSGTPVSGRFTLEQWVMPDGGDAGGALDFNPAIPEAVGFPGAGDPGQDELFAGEDVLVDPKVFVFVFDTDSDLTTFEAFPTGVQIQMRINEDVLSLAGRSIEEIGLASSTVGPDTIPPEVLGTSSSPIDPVIIPGKDEIDVDPETNIEVQFTEPIQILTIAELDDGTPPALSTAVQIEFGPPAARVKVPFFVRPFSVYDLSRLELSPIYNLPGSGPDVGGQTCGTFGRVTLRFERDQYSDLSAVKDTIPFAIEFTTREGPGLVNAPVSPDAIYVGRGGATPGISVIDLNGFGGGTGNPSFDPLLPIQEGNSNYPNNPNVRVLGSSLSPPLTPGTCTFNGGSEGVFTMTKDSSLGDLLARAPTFDSVGDMALGHSLDNTFNNGALFGCQAGGGNICAITGLKRITLQAGGAGNVAPATATALAVKTLFGMENLVSFAPHPNPPPIVFPPLCLSPLINGVEPTTGNGTNLLVPGSNSRGNPGLNRPPTSMLGSVQTVTFTGPSVPQPIVQLCATYDIRQQIGHYLYVIDRVAAEIVVLNSNRFTVIDRIRTPDPTALAMSPNLDFLAVSNEGADQVSFIDTDPSSASLHKVVRTVTVGAGPTGIAWDSGNEDIFVCNQADGSVTIISAFTLRARKTLRNQLTRPIEVVLTPRQLGFGFNRGVYFGYILNQDGKVAVFESGPDGILGWGFDDTIGTLPFTFFRPKAMQTDVGRPNSAVWIVHENRLSVNGEPTGDVGGAVSNAGISSGFPGIVPFINGPIVNPGFRNLGFGVFASFGEGPNGLSGIPVDIAFDNLFNASAFTNYSSQFSAGQPLSINGKSVIKFNGTNFQAATFPDFMFLAVPNPGVIDVLDMSAGTLKRVDASLFQPGINSIPAPNVTVVADYFRQ